MRAAVALLVLAALAGCMAPSPAVPPPPTSPPATSTASSAPHAVDAPTAPTPSDAPTAPTTAPAASAHESTSPSRERSPSGTAAIVAPPEGTPGAGAAVSGREPSGEINAKVAAMRAGFRRCYARALEERPDMRGSARIELTIDGNGNVSHVAVTGMEGAPPTFAGCIAAMAKRERFPDSVGLSKLVIPTTE